MSDIRIRGTSDPPDFRGGMNGLEPGGAYVTAGRAGRMVALTGRAR